jgi:hypothetical protein
MKIGILGSGDVGQKLADDFIELGRHVRERSNFSYCLGPIYQFNSFVIICRDESDFSCRSTHHTGCFSHKFS